MAVDVATAARTISILVVSQVPIPVNQNRVLEIFVQEQGELLVPLQHVKGVPQIGMPDGKVSAPAV